MVVQLSPQSNLRKNFVPPQRNPISICNSKHFLILLCKNHWATIVSVNNFAIFIVEVEKNNSKISIFYTLNTLLLLPSLGMHNRPLISPPEKE